MRAVLHGLVAVFVAIGVAGALLIGALCVWATGARPVEPPDRARRAGL